ncbi:conserved Plasmodium protein, unknown function [Plasmodium gallinaceum]|uniref:Uncharacterized protein n=1 Tax=Plasmodium gallinaceum TaxID=5849 RepID=A0A1J1GME6_PLAGA|nr:conserved Plasmodium protein, unknown function [Plasmodium gallinaceum]CRG93532.1 conserved Plasmodium protein, unknown function [Plasmodium gallinaceum]
MDRGLEKLLNQINDLESKNRLINIHIEELKTTESELQKKEKELISEIEYICKQLKCMEKEEIELNNDISRVNLICKNVEATLHNEFVKVEISAQKINQVEEYYEENDKKINEELMKSDAKIKKCLLNLNDTNDDFNKLKEIKNDHFLLNHISLEELYEIYEETKEKYQNSSFKNQCDQIVIVDYKTYTYFCNPTHLLHMINILIEKIKQSNNDPHFNLTSMGNYCGLKEQKTSEQIENFGLSELNKIMISHYKSKKINVNSV